jgi:hypothetical protein
MVARKVKRLSGGTQDELKKRTSAGRRRARLMPLEGIPLGARRRRKVL